MATSSSCWYKRVLYSIETDSQQSQPHLCMLIGILHTGLAFDKNINNFVSRRHGDCLLSQSETHNVQHRPGCNLLPLHMLQCAFALHLPGHMQQLEMLKGMTCCETCSTSSLIRASMPALSCTKVTMYGLCARLRLSKRSTTSL